ncbi:hypothetical protein K440DRAFT_641552 [Wilcoxina mikolae CBS 423.85]|nr:hypothetical protein K440DRAFT_641552 [Wilcoxina mikolae CBS 423.85]
MVTTHKYEYPPNSSTPGTTRQWGSSGTLTAIPLYDHHNLPPSPQRKGAAGGKLLIKTTHLSQTPLSLGRVVESFHDGYTMGEVVLGPFGWSEYVLHDMRHTSPATVDKVSSRDLPRYLALAAAGTEAWFGVKAVGDGRDGVLMVSGAATGTGVLAAQIARAAGWREVWGLMDGEEGVAVAKGNCDRVWEVQDPEWRGEIEMVAAVLVCGRDREILRELKRGAVAVVCGGDDIVPEIKGLLDERGVRLERVRASEQAEQREEALDRLEKLVIEGKVQVAVNVRKGRFEDVPEVVRSAGVGEIIVELVE